MNRTVKQKIAAQKVNMDGHFIDQPLPAATLDSLDPFLLIHHWNNRLPGGQRPQEAGVGPHPHRGFSPVTFIYKGAIEHRDSMGNKATVGEGGTQWMFAGRGITHSERFPRELTEKGGDLEFVQFWVNVPSANKMEAPFYKPISAKETPLVEEDKSKVYVVTGNYKGTEGAVSTYTPQLLLRGELEKDGEVELPVPSTYNALIYVLEGGLKIDNEILLTKDMVVLNNDGDAVKLKATADTRYLVLSGEPINEPVESYGPFVLNNQTQVMQAVRDAQMGKMGILIEEFD
jgi:redox-sensitive bicupin YhaK (pirin superfamily)